ncbi:MAG: hypothetical protein IT259_00465 [Saprospiraceae bacterium]|nr:hypothetical protein [Saprospiraceae bacterium]
MKIQMICWLFSLLLLPLSLSAQELDAANSYWYRDSLEKHKALEFKYRPHRCINRNGKYGWAVKNHKMLIPCRFEYLSPRFSPLMPAAQGSRHGALNASGVVMVPFQYEHINGSIDGRRAYAKNARTGLWSAWDAEGRQIIPEEYESLSDYQDTLIRGYHPASQEFRLLDHTGRLRFAIQYKGLMEMSPGRYMVSQDYPDGRRVGILDEQYRVVMPLDFLQVFWVRHDWAYVQAANKQTGLYHFENQIFTPTNYYSIGAPFDCPLLTVYTDEPIDAGKAGLMDSTFRFVVPPVFKKITAGADAQFYLLQTTSNRYGACDCTGRIVMDTVYNAISRTYQPLAEEQGNPAPDLPFYIFQKDDTSGPCLFHTRRGIVAASGEYDHFTPLSDSIWWACRDNECRLMGFRGPVIDRSYKGRWFVQHGFLWAQPVAGDPFEVFLLNGAALPGRYRDVKAFHQLEEKYWPEAIRCEETEGYGVWVAFARSDPDGALVLIDITGKVKVLSKN